KHLKEDGRKKAFEEEVQTLRANRAKNTSYAVGEHMIYDDVMRGRFKITKLVRFEHKFNPNIRTSFKVGDITLKTTEEMIKEGEDDALIEISH
ncbi:MAG TPA: hypothetical protein VLE21_01725, partial [Candidatus Nitrosocosmicus sp.]|nr:hypothetical protein [Candidatus Nitrosocosmicus sp.]